MRWARMKLGVVSRGAEGGYLISNAREDNLQTVERWCMMMARRCALPVRGYRWRNDGGWSSTAPVWAPGIFEGGRFSGSGDPTDLRAVTIAEAATDGATPVLLDEATMLRWLSVPQWDALDVLHETGRQAVAA